ncbi:MaoC/PaaZ C-terminal domain-containing protein [Pararhizobium mangrovi]|uniref:MaoC family dehydratase n=1 Tax=Pararhizobium mangrovi TaxID=2590452 RepID=A0A506UAT7_9HYPH|nr:MaoC/PaaZ C-terminal domain-containing protein [Pararhizobium mangrovi]TPW30221.1 MaoC family dehydratase [Pararhizobium mangrovi]
MTHEPSRASADLTRLEARVGCELGVSAWEHFDQQTVDRYGALTGEDLPIHCELGTEAAARFGGTIVQASLLLARLGTWVREVGGWIGAPATPVNYGFDKVRMLAPVPVGAAVRGRFALKTIERRGADLVLLRLGATVECEVGTRPAIVAEWIIGFIMNETSGREEQRS